MLRYITGTLRRVGRQGTTQCQPPRELSRPAVESNAVGSWPLSFLFTAPRFHTNEHYAVKALLEAGHEVAFFALRRGGSKESIAWTIKIALIEASAKTKSHD